MNGLMIENHETLGHERLEDFSCSAGLIGAGCLQVYFKDLESHLIGHIRMAEAVVGCVAWLTSMPVLRALAGLQAVSIIVQKEDFLRPDLGDDRRSSRKLRDLYDALPAGLYRCYTQGVGILRSMAVSSGPKIEAVRCMGVHNRERRSACPRMHHKFLVFCDWEPIDAKLNGGCARRLCPYAVWTGSFNFTANAGRSFENAVLIYDEAIAQAYRDEWAQVAALSEPLNWKDEWCAPEWRIGT